MLEHRNVCLLGPPGRGVSSILNGLEAAGEHRHQLDMRGVSAEAFNRYVKELATGEVRITLLLDHLEQDEGQVVAMLRANPDLRIVAAPTSGPPDGDSWWEHFEALVVPPLDSADAQLLGTRLLAGQGITSADALALAIEKASAGLPYLIHRLVHRVYVDRTLRDPKRIPELLLDLVGSIGDSTRLRRRVEDFGESRWDHDESVAFDCVHRNRAGCSIDDITLALVSNGTTLHSARRVIQGLLAHGWLVERDGRIDFEHPLLREQWGPQEF
jgi:hypothetical protein